MVLSFLNAIVQLKIVMSMNVTCQRHSLLAAMVIHTLLQYLRAKIAKDQDCLRAVKQSERCASESAN
jgi:hypothetical protein